MALGHVRSRILLPFISLSNYISFSVHDFPSKTHLPFLKTINANIKLHNLSTQLHNLQNNINYQNVHGIRYGVFTCKLFPIWYIYCSLAVHLCGPNNQDNCHKNFPSLCIGVPELLSHQENVLVHYPHHLLAFSSMRIDQNCILLISFVRRLFAHYLLRKCIIEMSHDSINCAPFVIYVLRIPPINKSWGITQFYLDMKLQNHCTNSKICDVLFSNISKIAFLTYL